MARSTAREAAMQLIFEHMLGGQGGEDTLALTGHLLDKDDNRYLDDVTQGLWGQQARIDQLIMTYAQGWTLERMARVDLAILRLAIYEMLTRDDIPCAVSINEAVELSRRYSTLEAGSFINGILGNIGRYLERA